MYRAVTHTSAAADDVTTTTQDANKRSASATAAATAATSHGARKVVVLDAESPPVREFKSSLLAAVHKQPAGSSKSEREVKNGSAHHGRGHNGGGGRGKDRAKSPRRATAQRDRSASPHKRSDRPHSAATATAAASSNGRVVTSLSAAASAASSAHTSSSPKKLADRKKQPSPRHTAPRTVSKADADTDGDAPPRRFVSSLTGSVVSKDTAGVRLSDSSAGHERAGNQGARGTSGRESRRQQQQHGHRVVEDASHGAHPRLSEKNLAAHASATSRTLRRKNSAESMSSMRSGRSERSDYSRSSSRWGDRDARYAGNGHGGDHREARYAGGGDHRYDDSRHSTGNGGRAHYGGSTAASSDVASTGRFARSVSDASRSHTPSQQQQSVQGGASVRSSQDVRFQKSTSSVSSHSQYDARGGRSTPDTAHSAPANTPGAAAVPFRSSAQDVRASSELSRSRSSSLARSVVSDADSSARDAVQRSPSVASAGVRKTPAFTSSLTARSAPDVKESSAPTAKPAEPAIDIVEQKRLASEALAKKFEARQAERERLKAAAAATSATTDASGGKREFRSGITLTASASAAESPSPARTKETEKEQRVREHYAKVQHEDAMKEAARRANGFTSSLIKSIAASLSAPATPSRVQKTCYALSELRRYV